jgi:sugar O-acyltransferase (sialic acid O-acetyltransferase NeuD family)
MTGKPVIVFGTGALPDQVHYYFSQHGGRRIEAFTLDAEFLTTNTFAGLPVLPFDEAQRRFPPATHDLFVAVGYSQFCAPRKRIFLAAQALGYTLPSFVHESAVVARNATIGANCLLRELAVVSPFATLGDNVFLSTNSLVSHHARVAGHTYLAAGALVSGSARIGERCFLGARSTVRDGVSVGEGCIIGAGALIMSDCAAGGVYAAPATPRRERR